MLKRIGISVAALCAAFVLAKPPAAAAADRDDYNNRPSYQQSERRNSYGGYQSQGRYSYGQYQPQTRYRDDRRSSEWRDHSRGNQRQSWKYGNRNRHESDER